MSETKPVEAYDLEAVYDAEIAPLMAQILAVCKRERMPMIASFAYAVVDDEDRSFCTSHMNYPERNVPSFHAAERAIRGRDNFMALTITGGGKR